MNQLSGETRSSNFFIIHTPFYSNSHIDTMLHKRYYLSISLLLLSISLLSALDRVEATEDMKDTEHMILDFSRAEDRTSWRIVNDGVMGGISQSEILFGDRNQDQ